MLRLVQWLAPFNDETPYPPPINRIALMVPDLDPAVGLLKDAGVPFLSEIAPCCSGAGMDESGIVHAMDPDGIAPRKPQPAGCPPLEIKQNPPAPSQRLLDVMRDLRR